ncbi:MAG: VacB/RNase II family 3'-5' exoribonuclease [Planctomycetota bacterium]
MPQRYAHRILDHIADRRYAPSTARELIQDLDISEGQAEQFRSAIDGLLEAGQVVRGTADTIALPPPGKNMVGTFRRHEKGFGFLVPDELTEHGDLFIPPGNVGDAMTGDKVKAKVIHEKRRALSGSDKSPYIGRIIEVLTRAEKQYSGTLIQKGNKFGVQVDGRIFTSPVLIRDPHAKNAKPGDKVVIDLTEYPDDRGGNAEGVIVEVLGEAGEPDVETLAVMRASGLYERFPDPVMQEARDAARKLDDDHIPEDREDLTGTLICTIDPPDAKDYDDAISVTRLNGQGPNNPAWELGVHIADVAHYITPGSELDQEAYARGNSTYLPRKVIPMLPEVLSNGVCSLMEGVNRFAKTVFLTYDDRGHVLSQRFAKTVIRSAKRLTYIEAQALIEDDIRTATKHCKSEPKYPRELIQCLKRMDELAKTIQKRRQQDGMIVLGLPAVDLVFDDTGRVVDAVPEDDAFTHKLIEMFMVEANEAAARAFSALDVPMIRRVHPDPDAHDLGDLKAFARVAGYNIPSKPSRLELQNLLDSVRGKPAQHAVHMAVLKTLSKAEYSPTLVGHFALASEHYTHFTSPIRRYPDFVVHRSLDVMLEHLGPASDAEKQKPSAKKLGRTLREDDRIPNEERMREIGRHCSTTERNSESAERELRKYLILELLATKLGEDFPGTVTGVTGQGIYLQIDRYLIDGFIRVADLPGPTSAKKHNGKGRKTSGGDRWQLNRNTGALVAQRSGRVINIGDRFPVVRIASVDLPRRQLELVIVEDTTKTPPPSKPNRDKPSPDRPKPKQRKRSSGETPPRDKKKKRGKRGGSKTKKSTAASQTNAPAAASPKNPQPNKHQQTLKLKKHRGKKTR